MLTLYTFGDSILDCGRYNPYGVTPGGLLVRNDGRLFPEFKGQDLLSRGPARLQHRAVDGATMQDLAGQARGLRTDRDSIALVTIGGNDLLFGGLVVDRGSGIVAFERQLNAFLYRLSIRPVYVGNVYDPTFGDDARNFLPIDPTVARTNHRRINEAVAEAAARHGVLVDLHTHFLTGSSDWLTHTIEPSLRGASEIRRCFWRHIDRSD